MSSRQSPKKVETFRGAVFNEDELARQLANSTGFDRLFAKSRLDSEIKRPPHLLLLFQFQERCKDLLILLVFSLHSLH